MVPLCIGTKAKRQPYLFRTTATSFTFQHQFTSPMLLMQLVVVMYVCAAVIASTITFKISSRILSLFHSLYIIKRPSFFPLYGGVRGRVRSLHVRCPRMCKCWHGESARASSGRVHVSVPRTSKPKCVRSLVSCYVKRLFSVSETAFSMNKTAILLQKTFQ